MKSRNAIAAAIVVSLPASPALAGLVTIDATDAGWYDSSGNHGPANPNYAVGSNDTYRNWAIFDLSGVVGTVTAAEYRFNVAQISLPVTIEWVDVTTDLAILAGGTGGIPAYDDLGMGTVYGTHSVAGPQFTFESTLLNAAAVSDINDAVGGDFAIAGHQNPVNAGFAFFGSDYQNGNVQIILTIPSPAGLAMFGCAALVGRRRRR